MLGFEYRKTSILATCVALGSGCFYGAAGETGKESHVNVTTERGVMKTGNESASNLAARYAITISNFANLLGVLASPGVMAKAKDLPSREHLLRHIDDYIAAVDAWEAMKNSGHMPFELNGKPLEFVPHGHELRKLCENWTPSAEVPKDIMDTARAMLAAMGFSEPPGGWDEFEGYPAQPPPEPESPDPRPPPTAAELAAQPDIVRVNAALVWCQYLASPKMVAKISPADLRRPALSHIDTLLASVRPVRSNRASTRARWIFVIHELEALRALCDAWDGSAPPTEQIRKAALELLMHFENAKNPDEYLSFDENVEPFYLQTPQSP